MRALLLLVVVLTACTIQPNAGASPTPSPTASPTATATQSPTSSPTPSPSPITLPSFAQVSAPSTNVVWVLLAAIRLFRSSDRGDTWVERSMPPGLVSTEVSFADDTRGLLLNTGNATTDCQTQPVSLGKTVDGAASWQQVPQTGIADAMCKQGLASADPTHAYLAASRPGTNPVIYRTAKGGTSWTASAPLSIPPNLASHGALYMTVMGRPRAFGSVILVEAGAGQTKDIFRSTDGGATFTYASAVTPEGAVAYVTATRW